MAKEEFVVGRLLALFKRSLQLEITCWCLLNATKEVQSVASASCVELWLQVLEAMWHDLLLLAQIIDGDPEGSGFLCEEVRVVFDGLYETLPGQEVLRQLLDLFWFQTIVIEVKACAKHVGLQYSHVVLSVQAEDVSPIWYDEVTILGLSCAIQDAIRLSFRPKFVVVRIIGEDAHIATWPQYVHQVMHIVLVEDLVFLRRLFCSYLDKAGQIDLIHNIIS